MSMILNAFCLSDKRIFVLALSIVLLNQTRKTVENKGVEPFTFPIIRDDPAPIG